MSRTERGTQFPQTDAIRIMHMYRSGDPAQKNEAMAEMTTRLTNYIRSIIMKSFPTYAANYEEDMVSVGYIAVLEYMPRYDATISLPSTFFHGPVLHALSRYVAENFTGTTAHYSSNIAKIRKSIARLQANGISNPGPEDIACDTDIPLHTVEVCLDIIHCSSPAPEYDESYMDSGKTIPGPEDAAIKKQESQTLFEALMALKKESPVQYEIVRQKHILQKDSYLKSEDMIQEKEYTFREVADTIGLSVEDTKRLHAKAIRFLGRYLTRAAGYHDPRRARAKAALNEGMIPITPDEEVRELSSARTSFTFVVKKQKTPRPEAPAHTATLDIEITI